jgi:hypothetical protein
VTVPTRIIVALEQVASATPLEPSFLFAVQAVCLDHEPVDAVQRVVVFTISSVFGSLAARLEASDQDADPAAYAGIAQRAAALLMAEDSGRLVDELAGFIELAWRPKPKH